MADNINRSPEVFSPRPDRDTGDTRPTAKPRQREATLFPWTPRLDFDAEFTQAVQAVWNGQANAFQQRTVLEKTMKVLCGVYDLEFRPGDGENGRRMSDFASGMRFVGLELVKHLNAMNGKVRDENG